MWKVQSNHIIGQVIVDQNSYQTDRIFDYIIPTNLQGEICVGMRVIVPFGKGNKRLEAYVLNIEEKVVDTSTHKEMIEAIDYEPILTEDQIKMILWMKNKYLCKYIEAIHCLIPAGIVQKERKIIKLMKSNWRDLVSSIQSKQRSILEVLEAEGGSQFLELIEKSLDFKEIYSAIKNLAQEKIIEIEFDLTSRVKVKTEEYLQLTIDEEGLVGAIKHLKSAKKQGEILVFLQEKGRYPLATLIKELNTSRAPIKSLVEK